MLLCPTLEQEPSRYSNHSEYNNTPLRAATPAGEQESQCDSAHDASSTTETQTEADAGEGEPSVRWPRAAREKWSRWWADMPPLLAAPVMAFLAVGLLFVAAGPVFATFTSAMSSNDRILTKLYIGYPQYLASTEQPTCPPLDAPDPFLLINPTVIQVLPGQLSARILLQFLLSNNLSGASDTILNLPQGDDQLVVTVGSFQKTYSDGDILQKEEITEVINFTAPKSSYTFYPFDHYLLTLFGRVYIKRNDSRVAVSTCLALSVVLSSFENSMDSVGFFYDYGMFGERGVGNVTLFQSEIQLWRNATTMFFSIFIVMLMWGLSGFVFALVLDHSFIRPREMNPACMNVCVSTLFALPAVRNVQPDVPPIGSAVDVIGFFWNMSLVGLCTMVVISGYVACTKYPTKLKFKYKGA